MTMMSSSVWVQTTTSKAYKRVDISLVSRGTLESLARQTTESPLPSYHSSPSLTFSSFSYFTHLQPDDTTTKKCSVKLNCHGNILMARSQAPSLQNSFPSGVGSGHQTYVPTLHYMPDSNYNRRCTSGRGPIPEEANAIGDSRKKNDRDRSTLPTGYSLRVHNSRRTIPGKIWMSTNQNRAIVARAHVYRQITARAAQASQGI